MQKSNTKERPPWLYSEYNDEKSHQKVHFFWQFQKRFLPPLLKSALKQQREEPGLEHPSRENKITVRVTFSSEVTCESPIWGQAVWKLIYGRPGVSLHFQFRGRMHSSFWGKISRTCSFVMNTFLLHTKSHHFWGREMMHFFQIPLFYFDFGSAPEPERKSRKITLRENEF